MKVKLVLWFARVLGVPADVHSSYFIAKRGSEDRYGVPHVDGRPIKG